ncbi:MAG: glutamyl-tRNA reductase [Legionellaceae bacterium]|nr:glutamyl-tRNA reductase [Legionellaceae bacterium]
MLLACGINHNTADLALRERVAISHERLPVLLAEFLAYPHVSEVALLSTCNRTEIYAEAENAEQLLAILAEACHLEVDALKDVSYQYAEQDMVRHVMRVACGLDSMVVGEPEILGQLKSAVAIADEHAAIGPELSRLFQQVFNVAKRIRTHTEVGVCPVSVASTAVSFAKDIFPELSTANVLLIGAGDTVALTAKHLVKQGAKKIVVASRKLAKAEQLAHQFSGNAIALNRLSDCLPNADIIFTATASTLPILGKGAVETALKKRNKPIVIIDIAVPRDVEPEVAELDQVHLYSIDDLKNAIQSNLQDRQHAAQKAEEMIVHETQHYMNWLRSLISVGTIRALRNWADNLREEELLKAQRSLALGVDPKVALTRMANALSNKLLHPPSVKLREASYNGREEFIAHIQELFDLDQE